MADFTPPTLDQFRARFPEFDAVAEDDVVTATLAEAGLRVDDTWSVGDYPLAILYLAAHLLSSAADAAGGGAISSESFGPISVSYAKAQTTDGLANSAYGLRFLELVSLNHGGPLVV